LRFFGASGLADDDRTVHVDGDVVGQDHFHLADGVADFDGFRFTQRLELGLWGNIAALMLGALLVMAGVLAVAFVGESAGVGGVVVSVLVIRAGARGYVTKNIAGAELAEAIERVRGGDAYFSPRLAGFVLDAFASGPVVEEDDPAVDSLTRRELEVLRLLARGYTYKEIAERLFISVKTVETHASNILRKTQTSNRHQLTRWAVARDLG